jgi:phosphatidylinositol glycan class W
VEKVRNSSRKSYLSSYRLIITCVQESELTLAPGMQMLVTCVSILAIDFTVFPRRYGKTENYGTGLVCLLMSSHGIIVNITTAGMF